jgi:crotonobetainyl-CoA:carnitine CoA-transferase CaiB-like acyl-CoA transferase
VTPRLLAGAATVLDLSSGIAGPYCTKLLADAGADVVKVESGDGDPLRRWTASGAPLGGRDGALFRYLNAGKRSIVATGPGVVGDDPAVQRLLAGAALVVDDGRIDRASVDRLRETHPGLVVVSITPFGLDSPWAGRPSTEFTLQALCGSTAGRGRADERPLHVGGRLGEWISGVYAAFAGMAALHHRRHTGTGDHVDVAMLECMAITMGGYGGLMRQLGAAAPPGPPRSTELPSIVPTKDGFVGFCTITGQQFADFLVMIERGDLVDDRDLATFVGRQRRRDEFVEMVHDWTMRHTTDEIIELASLFRIPVSPIGTPTTVTELEQFIARGVYGPSADGDFRQPRVPYRVDGEGIDRFGPAPALGEHTGTVDWPPLPPPIEPASTSRPNGRDVDAGSDLVAGPLPLAGVRVVDLTAFWAGPAASLALGALGADVIKVESVQRPDGMRFASAKPPGSESWWEWSGMFQAVNANKRDVTLNLRRAEGRALLDELIAEADVLIENFSPRVLDDFGLDQAGLAALNPRLITIRMPAFGLDGPWRDRTGFAQTMEQASGMAWMTGEADGPPLIPRGACDPLAGMHAAFATVAALDERERTGCGHYVESTMVEAALNVAAEIVLEQTAYGATLARAGNRGPVAAPQGLYPCRGEERWLALAVATDEQWQALCGVLGDPPWTAEPAYRTAAGRRAQHDAIDAELGAWAATQDLQDAAAALSAAGVPAEPVLDAAAAAQLEPFRARGFVETVDHPVIGPYEVIGLPFRFASHRGSWYRTASPTLGQHNDAVLGGLLGHTAEELAELRDCAVIGEHL